jgi:hypothetical protein
MDASLPPDLCEYVQAKRSLNDRQRQALLELAEDCQGNDSAKPDELARRYVRRCLKSGWFAPNATE